MEKIYLLQKHSHIYKLGSTVRNNWGARNDIMNRLNKTRNIFWSFNNMWKSSQYSKKTKVKLYNSFYYLLCYMDLNVDKWQNTTLQNSIPWVKKESCTFSSQQRYQTRIYFANVIKKTWLQYWQEDAGSELGMSWEEIREALHWTPEAKLIGGRPKTHGCVL